jgi:hypothetical protein
VFVFVVLLVDGFYWRRRPVIKVVPVYVPGEVIPPETPLIIRLVVRDILLPP